MGRPADKIFPEAKREQSVDNLTCVKPPFGCGKPIEGFRDQESKADYKITGMCQICQDKFYGYSR